jgi:predicted transcriptional regulator
MVKKYVLLSNEQREELCRLIHRDGLTIKEAAKRTGIPYPNAKAVNKTFEREQRTDKRHVKVRSHPLSPNQHIIFAKAANQNLDYIIDSLSPTSIMQGACNFNYQNRGLINTSANGLLNPNLGTQI